uniref:Uncharacterized protein n=1 Tax=Anguilla anguilla TaxID=7936 RepID=A0A0E9P9J0_ANGAN
MFQWQNKSYQSNQYQKISNYRITFPAAELAGRLCCFGAEAHLGTAISLTSIFSSNPNETLPSHWPAHEPCANQRSSTAYAAFAA